MPAAGTDTRVVVECTGCGVEMKRFRCQIRTSKTGRWFCGTECRNKVGSKPRRKPMRTCMQCSEDFYPNRGGVNKFCSKDCQNVAQCHQVELCCEQCGKNVNVQPSRRMRWCSWSCYSIARGTPLGKRAINESGYAIVFRPDSPEAWKGKHRKNGWGQEQRVVMADMLGRALPPGSTVHHRNGIRDDNRPENLELWASTHKPGQRVLDLIDYARRILDLYGPDEGRLRELEADLPPVA